MTGLDLFAGAGGLGLGATQAGIPVALAVESDPNAAATYRLNHPLTTVLNKDIRALRGDALAEWARLRNHLIIFGGPPCQGFSWSNARTRNATNPSNWLFEEFLRIVKEIRPAWVLLENVQGFVNTSNGLFLNTTVP